ncbi:class I SAM-dependent methyltransferase [Bosea sp. 2RAB26]|uniref:class I SAM-dependent methyltransferase n=1 Tax=Bosea sp. 2RAB26 TaxID=3237476 RepID=UPI003F90DCF7
MKSRIDKLMRLLRQLRQPGIALHRLETFEEHHDFVVRTIQSKAFVEAVLDKRGLMESTLDNADFVERSLAARLRPYIDAILDASEEERAKILSLDQGQYQVGTTNSATRDAWVEKVLKELPAGARLLDAGAGECQYKKHCGHLRYVAQDVAIYNGKGDAGLHTGSWTFAEIDIVSDITAIPEADGAFDAVLCTEVLEHVVDPVAALNEMARLLKPGGVLIVTAPFWSLTHFAPFHYATGFNRYFHEHHLGRLGFEIVEFVPNGNFFECIGQEVRRIQFMAQQFSGKVATPLESYATQAVLAMAERLSAADGGSTEMLHFGCHVRAVKCRD